VADEGARRRSALRVLGRRNFLPYFIGNLLSNCGTWFQNIAQSLLIYRLTGSAFMVGVVNFAQFAGVVLLAPWTGSAADHYDRKRLSGSWPVERCRPPPPHRTSPRVPAISLHNRKTRPPRSLYCRRHDRRLVARIDRKSRTTSGGPAMKKAVIAVLAVTASGACELKAQGRLAAADAQTHRAGSWRVDLVAERAALAAADRAFSQATETRGMVDGFTAWFADGAAFLPPRSTMIRGRAAMQEYLRTSPLLASMRWENVRADVSADGRSGYTLGFGTAAGQDGSALHVRMITFWRRQANGEWKVEANVPALNPEAPRPVRDGFGTPRGNGVAGAGRRVAQAAAALAVQQADRDFAALSAARDPHDAFVAFAAPTGMIMGGPEYGPDEISTAFEGGGGTLEWGPLLGGAAASGDLGYTIGYAVRKASQPDGTVRTSYSKYLTIWQRQADGTWKYVADGGTSRPAPAS